MRTLAVVLADDYGKPEHGPSYEHHYFVPALKGFGEVEVFDFGPYLNDTKALQPALLQAAEKFKPDLVFFVLYQGQIEPSTLDTLKGRYTTCNWFCDDQWRYEGFSRIYAPHFTFVITTDPEAHRKYLEDGVDARLSQWAAGVVERPKGAIERDLCFIGLANPYRAWFVEALNQNGLKVDCYGTGWNNGRVTFEEANRLFATSRINLNLSNSRQYDARFLGALPPKVAQQQLQSPKNREQVKGRHFEIPAAGGFQLTNYVNGLEGVFDIGREVVAFATIEDCIEQARYYLKHEIERSDIATAGQRRVAREHRYVFRFERLFERELATCQ